VLKKIRGSISYDLKQKWLNKMANRGYALNRAGILSYYFDETQPSEYRVRIFPSYIGLDKFSSTAEYRMVLDDGYQLLPAKLGYYFFRKRINGSTSDDCFDNPRISLARNKSLLFSNICFIVCFVLLPILGVADRLICPDIVHDICQQRST